MAVRVAAAATYIGLALLAGLVVAMPHDWPSKQGVFAIWIPLASLSAVGLVGGLATADTWIARLLATPPAVWLGKLSYSLYLWHVVVFRALEEDLTGPAGKAAQLIVALAAAGGSYFLIEGPFRKLKKRTDADPRRA